MDAVTRTVTFEALDEDGRAVGRLPDEIGAAPGRQIHVAGVLPGETARVTVEHESPHAPRAWGSLVELVGAPSPERVPPSCPGHGRCGGCILQHLAYPAQLTEKRERVERALREHARLAGAVVSDVVASPHELHYRNKAKYVVAPGRGGLIFGSYAPASHEIVPMAGCQVPEAPLDEVARAAIRLADQERVPGYDERERTGELRGLIARANVDGDVLVVFVARTKGPVPALRRVAHALRLERPEVRGVVLNVNPTTGGAIFGPEDVLLEGASALADTVGDVPLELSARAFFQVNRVQAARLYDSAARATGGARRVVDLYTGVGGIALTLARRGARVVGIEVHAGAVRDASATARKLGLAGRLSFEVGDAAAALPAAARFLGGVDAVVVNPPRKGLLPAARTAILELAPPRLVYVSCNPTTLAADLASLVGRGYRLGQVVPFDLMPGTPHIETLATLSL